MARELAYLLINPYTLAKSRTGGIIGRVLGRTDLELAAARMFGPSAELVHRYADLVRSAQPEPDTASNLIADYILRAYKPDPGTGRPRRVMLLLFEGENAVQKVWDVTGNAKLKSGSGQTIRDTYGDYVVDERGNLRYFEPAVLAAPSARRAGLTLRLWAGYSKRDGGIIHHAADVPDGKDVQRTLVMLKPDNFRYPSSRPGSIINILSTSGMRIVGARKFRMSVDEAEQFYGPVCESLAQRFKTIGCDRLCQAIVGEFGFELPSEVADDVCSKLGPLFARSQYEEIVKFMTGYKPGDVPAKRRHEPGRENCLALAYEGANAVHVIRGILGTTDPRKAHPGSVRREYGSNIMINAAHASDSPESARREMAIIGIEADTITSLVNRYYGKVLSRLTDSRFVRKLNPFGT